MSYKVVSSLIVSLFLIVTMSSFTVEVPAMKYSPAGSWEYSVPGVQAGYEAGTMTIIEDGKGYKVTLQLNEYFKADAEKSVNSSPPVPWQYTPTLHQWRSQAGSDLRCGTSRMHFPGHLPLCEGRHEPMIHHWRDHFVQSCEHSSSLRPIPAAKHAKVMGYRQEKIQPLSRIEVLQKGSSLYLL
jgi:hypothetical protein